MNDLSFDGTRFGEMRCLTMRGEGKKAPYFVTVWHYPEKETRGREKHVGQISVLTWENHSHQVDCPVFLFSDRDFTMIAQILCLLSHLSILVKRTWETLCRVLLLNFKRALLSASRHKFFASGDLKAATVDDLWENLSLSRHLNEVWGGDKNRGAAHHAEYNGKEEVTRVWEAAWVWSWSHKS